MSEFDIRVEPQQITSIRFSNDHINFKNLETVVASKLSIDNHNNRVEIRDKDYTRGSTEGYLVIANKEHAESLIKAIHKAIEFGWLE